MTVNYIDHGSGRCDYVGIREQNFLITNKEEMQSAAQRLKLSDEWVSDVTANIDLSKRDIVLLYREPHASNVSYSINDISEVASNVFHIQIDKDQGHKGGFGCQVMSGQILMASLLKRDVPPTVFTSTGTITMINPPLRSNLE